LGFAVWIDDAERLAWARGTHEYRPMGTAVIALTDQFRPADSSQTRRVPKALAENFTGFFGSLETVNEYLRKGGKRTRRSTPAHLL
jgi:hypothetical protein